MKRNQDGSLEGTPEELLAYEALVSSPAKFRAGGLSVVPEPEPEPEPQPKPKKKSRRVCGVVKVGPAEMEIIETLRSWGMQPMKSKEIAELTGRSKHTVNGSLNRLAYKGVAYRVPKTWSWALTDEGLQWRYEIGRQQATS